MNEQKRTVEALRISCKGDSKHVERVKISIDDLDLDEQLRFSGEYHYIIAVPAKNDSSFSTVAAPDDLGPGADTLQQFLYVCNTRACSHTTSIPMFITPVYLVGSSESAHGDHDRAVQAEEIIDYGPYDVPDGDIARLFRRSLMSFTPPTEPVQAGPAE
jgi:hypothetical protein